jgi:hypothetical protein
VRFVQDALNLGAIDSRELRMQFGRQTAAALIIRALSCSFAWSGDVLKTYQGLLSAQLNPARIDSRALTK